MGLYEEALAFKEKNGLYFHPLQDPKKRIEGIERNNRRCPCRSGRRCICEEALNDCRTIMQCTCLLFVSHEYLIKWCYVDEKGRVLSEKERKQLIKNREKEGSNGKSN